MKNSKKDTNQQLKPKIQKEKSNMSNSNKNTPTSNNIHLKGILSDVDMTALKNLQSDFSGFDTSALKYLNKSGLDMTALKRLQSNFSGFDMTALKYLSKSGVDMTALKHLKSEFSAFDTSALKYLNKSSVDMTVLKRLQGEFSAFDTSALKYLNKSGLDKNISSLSSNWVFSKDVIKKINSTENELLEITKKLSPANFKISQNFNDETENFEYTFKNKGSNESVPFKDVKSSLAVTDIIESVSSDEIFQLYNHLVKYPMLGLKHPVGMKIFEQLSKTELILVENIKVFRVRHRNITDKHAPFTELEMFEAPHGMASHGRYNTNGQGELYVCDDKEVAIKEVQIEGDSIRYERIEWELKTSVNLLDLSLSDSALVKYCSFEKSTRNNQEYILPNFIAQCAKFHGISGLIYKSVANPSVFNYVFFDFEKKWFETINLEYELEMESAQQKV